jgi:ankyrin repeat protein
MSIFRKQDRLNWSLGNRVYYNYGIDKVREALEAGADPNAKYKSDYSRRAVLYWAADRGRSDVVELLLQKGANPEGDRETDTPLQRAVAHGSYAAAKALLDAGANPNVKSEYRDSPLFSAASHGSGDMIQALVEKGADVNAQNSTGNTVLHIVASKGHANIVRYLLDHGADPKIENANMNTAADVAEKDYPRIAEMIRGKDAPAALPAPKADTSWSLTDAHEVARVKDKDLIGYRVTEIFNFSSRLYTQIAQNLKTGAESQSVKHFGEIDDGQAVEAAREALVKLGGQMPDTPEKKKLTAPGQG